ncbi:MAG TPA: SPOR domain-containing protein [Candidatus Desulfobacillus sp.]|nr:SPOR domain-containing protein [Candidatus Desulfobacillus sp.]
MRIDSGKSGQAGGTLIGLFIGLVVGVLVAAGVVWYLNKTPIPFQNKETRPATERAVAGGQAAAPAAPEPLPGKPGDKPPEKPRFDFYTILPGSEEPVPQAPPRTAAAPAQSGEALFLQAGAFQKPADADNLKARLALMGLEASVQQVTLPEKGVLHRVRIGPYANPDQMARARSLLAENGIDASVVRVKDGKDTN